MLPADEASPVPSGEKEGIQQPSWWADHGRRAADATLLLAAGTIGLAIFSLIQISDFRDQERRQLRPYVYAIPQVEGFAVGEKPRPQIQLKNGGQTAAEVAPVSWTPDYLGSRSLRWARQEQPTRLSSAARWLTWCAPAARRRSWRVSLNRRHSRSGTGWHSLSVTPAGATAAWRQQSARNSIDCGVRTASSGSSGRSCQRRPPGSLGRRTRSHTRVPVRERSPGGLSDCQHVSAAGCLLQWLLCVDEAAAVAARRDGCGVDRRNPCGACGLE